MKIETKFNVGDEVWFMCQNRSIQNTITSIRIYIGSDEYTIEYLFNDRYGDLWKNEKYTFPTKEELIKSL